MEIYTCTNNLEDRSKIIRSLSENSPDKNGLTKISSNSQNHSVDNKKISVGMINSNSFEMNNLDNGNKTDNVKLNDRLIEGDIEILLGVEVNVEGNCINNQPFEMEQKIDNCFTKITDTRSSIKSSSLPTKSNYRIQTDFNIKGSFSTSTNTSHTNQGKILYDTAREVKMFQHKITVVNNRIKKLKDQEEEMNRKFLIMKNLAIKEEKLKIEKNLFKNNVNNAKKIQLEKLNEKKYEIKNEKEKREVNTIKAKEELSKKRKENFDLARGDKILLDSMLTQFNSHCSNVNNCKYIKAKQESIQNRANRFKKKADKEEQSKLNFENKLITENNKKLELVDQLKNLEKLEEECMENLKKTINNKHQEFMQFKPSNFLKNKGLNSSMMGLHKAELQLNEKSINQNKSILIPSRNSTSNQLRRKSLK